MEMVHIPQSNTFDALQMNTEIFHSSYANSVKKITPMVEEGIMILRILEA